MFRLEKLLTIALSLSGWAIVATEAAAQGRERQNAPSLSPITTLEDVPQGTTIESGSIVPTIANPNPFQPASNPILPVQFPAQNVPYTLYPDSIFETSITEDFVKIRVSLEPNREGGNFVLGLPLKSIK